MIQSIMYEECRAEENPGIIRVLQGLEKKVRNVVKTRMTSKVR